MFLSVFLHEIIIKIATLYKNVCALKYDDTNKNKIKKFIIENNSIFIFCLSFVNRSNTQHKQN